jgi:hypothetical protein
MASGVYGPPGQHVQPPADPEVRSGVATATILRNPETGPTAPSTAALRQTAGTNVIKRYSTKYSW